MPCRCNTTGPSSVTYGPYFLKYFVIRFLGQIVFELLRKGSSVWSCDRYGQRKSDTPTFVNLVCVPHHEIRLIGYVGTDDLYLSRSFTARNLTLLKIMSDTSLIYLMLPWPDSCRILLFSSLLCVFIIS